MDSASHVHSSAFDRAYVFGITTNTYPGCSLVFVADSFLLKDCTRRKTVEQQVL